MEIYHLLEYQITNHVLSENIASITTQANKKMAKGELQQNGGKKINILLALYLQNLVCCPILFAKKKKASFITIWEQKYSKDNF